MRGGYPIDDAATALLRLFVIHQGVTTGVGNADGTSMTDATLIGQTLPSTMSILIILNPGGLSAEIREVYSFQTITGVFGLRNPHSGPQIAAGTPYALLASIGRSLSQTPIPVAAVYAHPDSVAELTVFQYNPSPPADKFLGIWLDMVNHIQDTTIRVKWIPDGATLRTFHTKVWTPSDDPVVYIPEFTIGMATGSLAVTVTVQSAVLEGAARNLPYRYIVRGA